MKNSINRKEIEELLPHRHPMLLIDALTNIEKLKSATAVVNVKKDSFYVTRSLSRTTCYAWCINS